MLQNSIACFQEREGSVMGKRKYSSAILNKPCRKTRRVLNLREAVNYVI
jgi:hypothetical protein